MGSCRAQPNTGSNSRWAMRKRNEGFKACLFGRFLQETLSHASKRCEQVQTNNEDLYAFTQKELFV